VEQARTLKRFFALRVGVDTEADVRREFGTPYEVRKFARSPDRALMYPHPDGIEWDTMVAVYIDPRGYVSKVDNGPDPRILKRSLQAM
jgi:hypothetical protein